MLWLSLSLSLSTRLEGRGESSPLPSHAYAHTCRSRQVFRVPRGFPPDGLGCTKPLHPECFLRVQQQLHGKTKSLQPTSPLALQR